MNRIWAVGLATAAALVTSVSVALATATPVGTLPAGPVKNIHVKVGTTFKVTLPKSQVAGRVWRVARTYNGKVVTETHEGTLANGGVWVQFRAVSPGTTKVVYALTRGETSHAYAARTFRVTVATV